MRSAPQAAAGVPPPDLRDTGLYADFETLQIDARHLAFSPQYPLWTDGATKRRWISLPPGSAIDASDPDAWVFPAGTRLWKEFSFEGKRVETRFMERQADGQWLYAAYAWSADGSSAQLVPERGKRGAWPLGGGQLAHDPGRERLQGVPSGRPQRGAGLRSDSASPDRDPGALHADLRR